MATRSGAQAVGSPSGDGGPAGAVAVSDVAVLVVEDDHDVRRSLAAVLRHARYRVAEAEDSLEALHHLESTTFAAVVLDLWLPGLSGLWLLDEIDDPPPVVLVTGRDYDYEVIKRQDKIFLYLKKPVPPPVLLSAVARATTSHPSDTLGPGGRDSPGTTSG